MQTPSITCSKHKYVGFGHESYIVSYNRILNILMNQIQIIEQTSTAAMHRIFGCSDKGY